MNQLVSLFAPTGNVSAAETPSRPALGGRRGSEDAPFSSVLDRVADRSSERRNTPSKATSQRSARSERSADDAPEVGAKSRDRNRVDRKKKSDDDAPAVNATCGTAESKAAAEDSAVQAATAENAPATDSQTASGDSNTSDKSDNTTPTGTCGVAAAPSSKATTTDGGKMLPIDGFTPVTGAAADGLTIAPATASLAGVEHATDSTTAKLSDTLATDLSSMTTAATESNPADLQLSQLRDASADGAATDAATTTDPKSNETYLSASSARAAEVLLAANGEGNGESTALTNLEASATAETQRLPEEARQVARAARKFREDVAENVDGIGSAKTNVTMKNAIKTEEVAGLNQQILPGSTAGAAATLPNLPSEARRVGAELSATSPSAIDALQAGKNGPAPVRADISGAEEVPATPNVSPLARVGELISREVRMFKRTGDDQVEVVLTPDAKTQISLRLQWREGQVEVQARCDFGDYGSLNTQWGQLQASMANHGVRLSHLSERTTTGFTEFFNNPNFAQQQSSGRERNSEPFMARPETLAGVPTAPKPGAATPVRRTNRLFDSWA